MSDRRQWIPLGGLVLTAAAAVYMVVQLNAQEATAGDFRQAATAEVRDAGGAVILQGQFAPVEEEDDDIERRAALTATGVDADAAGEAEVEFDKTAPTKQEVEFSARNLEPGTAFTFVIDGTVVATATADRRGRVEVEVDVPVATGPARR